MSTDLWYVELHVLDCSLGGAAPQSTAIDMHRLHCLLLELCYALRLQMCQR